MAKRQWRVLVGCQYPPDEDRRREPGELVDDIPPWLAKVLRADGIIEPASAEHDDDTLDTEAPSALIEGEGIRHDDTAVVHNTKARH